ncbi:MAG: Two component regulator three Y domain-containing protein, partial [Cellulophaga sp.]|nr:Two component regulator three Y domain-containing protein [Cellulophaga sp.]
MKYFLFFISFCFTLVLFSQKILPPIYNYKIFDYNAASQNWGITIDKEGGSYIANNKGLLSYNGEEWILNKLPNGTIIRSVKAVGNKIYTGSYEEFGYWVKNEFGTLIYTSLTHLIKNYKFTNEEFWQILAYEDSIIFRSFSTIYIYKNDTIKVLDVDVIVTDIEVHEDKILVSGAKSTIFKIENDLLVPFLEISSFNETIITMLSIPQGLLLGTKLEGVFLYADGKIVEWDKPLNSELKKYQLNEMIFSDGKVAFGTIKKGVFLFDMHKNSFLNLDRETGLQNNTVLAMVYYENQLWLGLDNGIDRVITNSPINYYT